MSLLETVPEHIPLASGVDLYLLPEARFKRAALRIDFELPLDQGAAARSLLIQVLEQGCAAFPSRMHLSQAQEDLFGASLYFSGTRAVEHHRVQFGMSWIGERFLPPGEELLKPLLGLGRQVLEQPLRGQGSAQFDGAIVERERAQLIRQIESMVDDRSSYARERFYSLMCKGEAFARPPWGTVEEVAALTLDDLEAARLELLEKARVRIFAAGPIEAGPFVEQLKAWWQSSPSTARQAPPAVVVPTQVNASEVREELPIDQARYFHGFRVPVPSDAAESEALILANSVFGGGIHGRLFRVVREEKSLAYGISSELRSGKGMIVVGAGIDAEAAIGVRDEIRTQWSDLRDNGPREVELAMAKASMFNRLESLGDAASSLMGHHARETSLGFGRSPAERAAAIEACTPQQVQAAAASWQEDLSYLLAAPEAALTEQAS